MDKSLENIMDDIENKMEPMSTESIHKEMLKKGQVICTNENLHLYGIPVETDLEKIMDDAQNEAERLPDSYVRNELSKAGMSVCTEENLRKHGIANEKTEITLLEKLKGFAYSIFGSNERIQGFSVAAIPALAIAFFSWNTNSALILAKSTIEENNKSHEESIAAISTNLNSSSSTISSLKKNNEALSLELSRLKNDAIQLKDKALSIVALSADPGYLPNDSDIYTNFEYKKNLLAMNTEAQPSIRSMMAALEPNEIKSTGTGNVTIATTDPKEERIFELENELHKKNEIINDLENEISLIEKITNDHILVLEEMADTNLKNQEEMYETHIGVLKSEHDLRIKTYGESYNNLRKSLEEINTLLENFDVP